MDVNQTIANIKNLQCNSPRDYRKRSHCCYFFIRFFQTLCSLCFTHCCHFVRFSYTPIGGVESSPLIGVLLPEQYK
uniref:Uncharacterized protein n=1 Tax=Arundo donax TaxID=35708 RepID=A0A0A8XP69_ARUDO